MKKYFLKDAGRERGPYMLDDLKYQRIRATTEVKIDDGDWHLVIDNPDLRSLLDLKKDNYVANSPAKKLAKSQGAASPTQANRKLVVGLAIFFLLISLGMALVVFLMAEGKAN